MLKTGRRLHPYGVNLSKACNIWWEFGSFPVTHIEHPLYFWIAHSNNRGDFKWNREICFFKPANKCMMNIVEVVLWLVQMALKPIVTNGVRTFQKLPQNVLKQYGWLFCSHRNWARLYISLCYAKCEVTGCKRCEYGLKLLFLWNGLHHV